jgi:hypothetical protein
MISLGFGLIIFLALSFYAAKRIRAGAPAGLFAYILIGLILSATWTYYAWYANGCQNDISCEKWEEQSRQYAHAKRYPVLYSAFTDSGWAE